MSTAVSLWFTKLKSHSKLERFYLPHANNDTLKLFVKRDDLIDINISGNKLRKLEGNLQAAKDAGAAQIITFGGAYSNHLLASAAAAKALDLPIIGKVRGEELNEKSNPMLMKCHQLGMEFNFLKRSNYKESKHQSGLSKYLDKPTWFIPEGGANPEGILGCTDIYTEAVAQNANQHFDAVFLAQGTTTTSLGILAAIPSSTQLFVVPVLKGFHSLQEMQNLAERAKQNTSTAHLHFPFEQVTVLDQYHHGGYAQTSKDLIEFINFFNQTNQFPIEPTYTGKVLYALNAQLSQIQAKNVLFIHTGGVQTFLND